MQTSSWELCDSHLDLVGVSQDCELKGRDLAVCITDLGED